MMGLFSGIDAIRKIQKMKQGGEYELSAAQISNVIINLPDAKRNLAPEQFSRVEELFSLFQKQTKKEKYGYQQYIEKAVDIAARFNTFAPYELYSGGGSAESIAFAKCLGYFDKEKYLQEFLEKMDEIEKTEQALKRLETTLSEARRTLSQCRPKHDIMQMAARGMIGQDVLEAYEVQEQVVLGFPGMIETTKSALRKLYEEKDRILTGC